MAVWADLGEKNKCKVDSMLGDGVLGEAYHLMSICNAQWSVDAYVTSDCTFQKIGSTDCCQLFQIGE